MFPPDKTLFLCLSALLLASCGTTSGKHRQPKPKQTVRQIQAVRISHIDRTQGSQELMLHSLGLIGTPYKWGGSSTATGFDCSGMIQFVYKNALNVKLPRTARDMAQAAKFPTAASRPATSYSSTPAAHTATHTSDSTSATANSSMPPAAAKPSKPKNSPRRFTPKTTSAHILFLQNEPPAAPRRNRGKMPPYSAVSVSDENTSK